MEPPREPSTLLKVRGRAAKGPSAARPALARPARRPICPRMASLPAARLLDRATPPHIVTLILVAGIPALSMNVFLPSLPDMARYFETDYRVVQLSISLYLGVTAAMQLAIGPISDRFGRPPRAARLLRRVPPGDAGLHPRAHDRDLPRLPHDAGRGRGGAGAEPRDRAGHGAPGAGRLDDRLRHHGHERGADGGARDRRLARRALRLARELLADAGPRGGRPRADLGRPRRDHERGAALLPRAVRRVSRAAREPPLLGLRGCGDVRLGRVLRLCRRRALRRIGGVRPHAPRSSASTSARRRWATSRATSSRGGSRSRWASTG